MEWETYWEALIEKKKLRPRIEELDQIDQLRGNNFTTKEICHKIFDNYHEEMKPHLEQVRQDFLKLIDQFQEYAKCIGHLMTDKRNIPVITMRYIGSVCCLGLPNDDGTSGIAMAITGRKEGVEKCFEHLKEEIKGNKL